MLNSAEHEISNAHKYKIPSNSEFFQVQMSLYSISPAHKYDNANIYLYFNIYEQKKLMLELSMNFYLITSGSGRLDRPWQCKHNTFYKPQCTCSYHTFELLHEQHYLRT